MTKPMVKEQAKLFADGFEKGYAAGVVHGARIRASETRRLAHATKRVAELARWRKYAIERLGVGAKLVAEISREAKKL